MIKLSLSTKLAAPLDATVLTPEQLSTRSLEEIKKLPLKYGAESVTVGELFKVSGKNDDTVIITGVTPQFHGLGRGLRSGRLRLEGDGGDFIGAGMRGGVIEVIGNVRDYVGAGMRAGLIDITGEARDFAGGSLPGATSGMKGGTILVGKTLGCRAGDRMRRGLLVANGALGAGAASQMIAGTLIALGALGPGAASGMRRGTLLARIPPRDMPENFVLNGEFQLSFLTLLTNFVTALKPALAPRLRAFGRVERWLGDRGCNGLGEILVPRH